MSSKARKHNSTGTASVSRAADEFSASYEELGIPDDEYFKRLNPHHGGVHRSSGLSAAMGISHKASSNAIAAGSGASDTDEELRSSPPRQKVEGETVVHTGASRHPTVVHREPRVRSSEGLLNQFIESEATAGAEKNPEDEYPTPADSPAREIHDDDDNSGDENTPVQRATSVKLGKDHVRKLSAGSAKLLDIPKRSQASTPVQPSTPRLPEPEKAS
jgi:hypothetical protein